MGTHKQNDDFIIHYVRLSRNNGSNMTYKLPYPMSCECKEGTNIGEVDLWLHKNLHGWSWDLGTCDNPDSDEAHMEWDGICFPLTEDKTHDE